jgi:hypothetical protein
MKRVVSVSLGSSDRNKTVEADFLGEKFRIERIGTDGDIARAIALISELDGKVDAFGMGGIDLYIYIGSRRYVLRDAARIRVAAKKTPMVDGTGVKQTFERTIVDYLKKEHGFDFTGKRIFDVCAVSRYGLAQALAESGGETIFGDLMFILGVKAPLRSLSALGKVATAIAPIVTLLPISMIYPTGGGQSEVKPKWEQYYRWADILAGDWHYLHHHMPEGMDGKMVITNTTTPADVEFLTQRGITTLVTTSPDIEGRSFGANVIEGVIVTLAGKRPEEMTAADYLSIAGQMGLRPGVKKLN